MSRLLTQNKISGVTRQESLNYWFYWI